MKDFVGFGSWYLPSNPDVKVSGRLTFSPGEGAKLEIYGSFYDSDFEKVGTKKSLDIPDEIASGLGLVETEGVPVEPIKPEEDIILGSLDNDEDITLYKCRGGVKKITSSKGVSTFLFVADYIFRKIHIESNEDIKFKVISVRYSNFEQWVEKSGLDVFITSEGDIAKNEGNKIWMSYKQNPDIKLADIDGLELYITFSPISVNPFIMFGGPYYKVNFEQMTSLEIRNPVDKSIEECLNKSISFRDLLSFSMQRPVSINSVFGALDVTYQIPKQAEDKSWVVEEEVQETKVEILFASYDQDEKPRANFTRSDMLFMFSDIENSLGNIFNEWIAKKQTYGAVFDLLMTTMYTPNLYIYYGFINVIQALEVYHTIKSEENDIYQDKKKYNKGLYKKFKEIINEYPSINDDPNIGITEEFSNVLKGKLKNQTRFTLETRLKEITSQISHILPNNFIGNSDDKDLFVKRASLTRNAYTHHNKQKRESAAKGKELFKLYYTLNVMIQVCLLRELGVEDESIRNLITRSRKYSNEWQPSNA